MNIDSKKRFGAFLDRVELERRVLRIVNSSAGMVTTLDGLTESTINSWAAKARNGDLKLEDVEKITAVLRRISARIDALADQSRVVFAGEDVHQLPTDELVDQLSLVCARVQPPAN